MKATKTIAALCAIGMVVSTMAMPVQAKTSKTETEIITMDDAPTTTTKNKTKKTAKKTTDEYKDWGKDLKVTVHTPEDFFEAYLYANMMCAKSLKITFAKDYKLYQGDNFVTEFSDLQTVVMYSMVYNRRLYNNANSANTVYDYKTKSVTMKEFGDVTAYFAYAYRTDDISVIPKDYKDVYNQLSKGVDSCTANANSITAVADNICVWLKENAVYYKDGTFAGIFGKANMRYDSDGKLRLDCEGYSSVFMIMMRMAGYTAYHVRGTEHGGRHGWNAIKVGDEYRYYEPQSTLKGSMTYKEMIKAGYKPTAVDLENGAPYDEITNPTQKQVEAMFIDWRY